MENIIIELVKAINPLQLAFMVLIFNWFYNRLDQKIEKLDQKIEKARIESKAETDRLNQRMDNLYQLFFNFFKKDAA